MLAFLLDRLELIRQIFESRQFFGELLIELFGAGLSGEASTSTFSSSPKNVVSFSESTVFLGDVILQLIIKGDIKQ